MGKQTPEERKEEMETLRRFLVSQLRSQHPTCHPSKKRSYSAMKRHVNQHSYWCLTCSTVLLEEGWAHFSGIKPPIVLVPPGTVIKHTEDH